MYISDHLKYDYTSLGHLNLMSANIELHCVSLVIPNMRQIILVILYRPPQGSIPKFIENLYDTLTNINRNANSEIYILGDFNMDMLDKKSQNIKDLIQNMKIFGGLPLINDYTRKSSTSTCIDQIFTNSDVISSSGIVNLNISDHLAVYCTRKKIPIKHEKKSFSGRSYRNYIKEDFQDSILNADWKPFYESVDATQCWDIMESVIRDEIDKICPIKTFRVSSSPDPWITNELLEEIRDKDLALKRARKTGKDDHWYFAKNERNRVGRLVQLARREFFHDEERNSRGDPKKFWRNISSCLTNKCSQKATIYLFDKPGNCQIDPDNTSNYINNFFANVGNDLAKHYNHDWSPLDSPNLDSEIADAHTDFEEVHGLCKEINASKSSAIDMLSSKVLKDAFLVLTLQLVYLFNLSLQTGIFPSKWKIATVIPLFKGGSKDDVSNYRPISLLPLPGKILEKIVHARISLFLEANNLLCDEQYGFRKNRSTTHSITNLTNSILDAVNKQETCLAVFIDLKKAFDTVNHSILIRKIDQVGIKGDLLRWVDNYLHKRAQRTFANNILSSTAPVICGVPQGSILGPLFFILYINDVKQYIKDVNIGLYADDTVLFSKNANWLLAQENLQIMLNDFVKWSGKNELTINSQKTKFMVFGSRSKVKKAKNAKLAINNTKIQLVPSFKYLGFTMDPVLSYSNHISTLLNVVSHKSYMMAKIRRYISEYSAIRIYKAMLLPYFDYADIIYDKANQNGLDKLQRVQNKCLKMCLLSDARTSTDYVHERTKVPKLENRRKVHLRNYMFQMKTHVDLLCSSDIGTRSRDAPLFTTKIPKCEAYKRSVLYNGAVEWNSLSVELRNMDLLLPFKFHQKRWLSETIH